MKEWKMSYSGGSILGYILLGLYRDNGKEHGNYCFGFKVWGSGRQISWDYMGATLGSFALW